jgi:hypothetical protein
MTIDHVRVGRFYVNEKKWLVREITSETAEGHVHWRSYWLEDGRPTGDSLLCSKYHITRWASREATPEEVAPMQRHEAVALENVRVLKWLNLMLENAPDERLLAEIRRRGSDVVRR